VAELCIRRERRWKWLASFLLQASVSVLIAGDVGGADPLDEYASQFRPVKPTLHIEYRVAYRLLAFELRQLARAELEVTNGTWSNRITGVTKPAALMDLRVGSLDSGRPPEQCRASVHARLLAVSTLPDLQVLLYGKTSHEWYNPTFGRRAEVHDISLYDMESGSLQFWKTNCVTGETTTNLSKAALLAEQSRQILPTFDVLREACRGNRPMLAPANGVSVQVSVDERVVPLSITTRRGRAPVSLDRNMPFALEVTVAPPRGSGIRARPFRAWVLPYRDAAELSGDAALTRMASQASPEGLVPLAVDYGLAIGSVRCTLTGMRALTNAPLNGMSSADERETRGR
jgi:hypothetical protein